MTAQTIKLSMTLREASLEGWHIVDHYEFCGRTTNLVMTDKAVILILDREQLVEAIVELRSFIDSECQSLSLVNVCGRQSANSLMCKMQELLAKNTSKADLNSIVS